MKFNFGHGALIVLLLFMAGMSYLVYRCSEQSIGLVSKEYYNEELKYSDQMSKERNSKQLGEKVDVVFNASSQEVAITYPVMNKRGEISGDVLFFKPDNGVLDFSVPVKADENSLQHIGVSKLQHGAWWIKINWMSEGVSYYNEEKIFIN